MSFGGALVSNGMINWASTASRMILEAIAMFFGSIPRWRLAGPPIVNVCHLNGRSGKPEGVETGRRLPKPAGSALR